MDISQMRQEFVLNGLSEENLLPDPMDQFELWFKQAVEGDHPMPNAMSIATVGEDGQPSLRTVLLKYFDRQGFVFFTNYESRKSREIHGNPRVSLLFWWSYLERQVVILGRAERVSTTESVKYFLSRPKGSQLGAWCSNQSSVINSRQMLMAKFEEIKQKFQHQEVPLPSFWGGFRIVPHHIEFWQGRENRLHDRLLYTLQEQGDWKIQRLAP